MVVVCACKCACVCVCVCARVRACVCLCVQDDQAGPLFSGFRGAHTHANMLTCSKRALASYLSCLFGALMHTREERLPPHQQAEQSWEQSPLGTGESYRRPTACSCRSAFDREGGRRRGRHLCSKCRGRQQAIHLVLAESWGAKPRRHHREEALYRVRSARGSKG